MNRSDGAGILEPDRILREWRWLCPGRVTIIERDAFGDLFLRDESGRIHMLNVGTGVLALVSNSISEFDVLAAIPEQREEWFAEADANVAAERGLIPGPEQCIAFFPPTFFAGANADPYLEDIYKHLAFLGDMHRKLAKLGWHQGPAFIRFRKDDV